MKILDFIKGHVDFKFHFVSVLALFVLLLIPPMLAYLPQDWGFENGLLEDFQMLVLFWILAMCVYAKNNKRIFKYAAFALLIIIFREINLGRTILFPIPGEVGKFYPWSYVNEQMGFPIGKCVHFAYGLYIAAIAILFIIKGIFKDGFNLVFKTKLPFWNLIFMGVASFCGAIAEKATNNNFIFEEGFELLFYVALAGVIYLYTMDDRYKIEEKAE